MERYSIKDGARHIANYKTFLGRRVFSERDVKRIKGAVPRDLDDDDGVRFASPVEGGKKTIVEIVASTSGYLNAWIDFNIDGTFKDNGEQVLKDIHLDAGINKLKFYVPHGSKRGDTYARFRFSTWKGIGYAGIAPDGEVEDYKINLK